MKGNKIFDFSRKGFQDIINIMTKKINEVIDLVNIKTSEINGYVSKVDGKVGTLKVSEHNSIHYTGDIVGEKPVGDIIIDINTGEIYISKGILGNKKILTE